jgi:GT2 family glycosyltransferase
VVIPTYEPSSQDLEAAVQSVLEQGVGTEQMQVAIVDDASRGFDPKAFVRSLGAKGRIEVSRGERRVGIGENWNRAVACSIGEWVHVLHQDDRVLPGFYRRLSEGIRGAPEVGAACTGALMVDERRGKERWRGPLPARRGVLQDWVENVVVELRIVATAMVVKRTVYEELGGFDPSYRYALDWDMWKRIFMHCPVWYEPEPLIWHREHEWSATRALLHDAENMREIERSIEHSVTSLSERVDLDVHERARRSYARFAVDTALKLLRYESDPVGALRQLGAARRLTGFRFVLRSLWRAVAGRGHDPHPEPGAP